MSTLAAKLDDSRFAAPNINTGTQLANNRPAGATQTHNLRGGA